MSVGLRIEAHGIETAMHSLARIAAVGRDLTPVMDEIGGSLVTSTRHRWDSRTGPDGRPWPALRPSTVRLKAAAGRERTLVWDGYLFGTMTHRASRERVEVGSARTYARFLQLGTERMVAREFLGLDADDRREIEAIVEDHLRGAVL